MAEHGRFSGAAFFPRGFQGEDIMAEILGRIARRAKGLTGGVVSAWTEGSAGGEKPVAWRDPDVLEPRILLSSTIVGSLYVDGDLDGRKSGSEQALSGWTVYLDENLSGTRDRGERSTTTDDDGSFEFDDLKPGFYDVALEIADGWRPTEPLRAIQTVTLSDQSLGAGRAEFGVALDLDVQLTEQPAGATPGVGGSYTLDLGSSALDKGVGAWTVDWGDGTGRQAVRGGTGSLTHDYAVDGIYLIQVAATDATGTHKVRELRVEIGDTSKGVFVPGLGFSREDLIEKRLELEEQRKREAEASFDASQTRLSGSLLPAAGQGLLPGLPGTSGGGGGFAMMSSTPSPVAHWTFDTDASDTAGTNDGTLQNGAAIGGGTSGRINAGVQLDGSNDYVNVAHTADLNVTKGYTLSAWIKPDDLVGVQAIISKVTNANDKQYLLQLRDGGSLQFEYEVGGNNYHHNFGGSVTANTWHHVAVTVSSTLEIRVYLDGIRLDDATTVTAPAEVNTNTNDLNIGRRGGTYNDRYFDGVIDDARLYHEVLDAAAIGDLANPANLPQVTLAATDDRASEVGQDAGQFTVTRTGDLVGDLVVNYTVSGNTVAGDYTQTLGGSVTILGGQASAVIDVTPAVDSTIEGTEALTLTLSADSAYIFGSQITATLTIADDATLATPAADAYVRGGGWEYSGLAFEDALTVKHDPGTPADARESFLKFDVSAFANTPKAILTLFPTDLGADAGTMTVYLEQMAEDDWAESDIRSTNKPTTGTALGSVTGVTAGTPVKFDITAAVQAAATSDGILTLRLYSTDTSGDAWVEFGSRDHADPTLRPELAVAVNPPEVTVTGNGTFTAGQSYDVTFAVADPTQPQVDWLIDWGDGSALQTATGNSVTLSHTFLGAETSYTVRAVANGIQDRRLPGTHTYADAVLADSPIAFWTLNEQPPDTTIADNSGSATVYDGQYLWMNSNWGRPERGLPGYAFGHDQTGVDFHPGQGYGQVDGDYVTNPGTALPQLPNGTISFFFKDTGGVGDAGIVGRDETGGRTDGGFSFLTKPDSNPNDDLGGYLQVRLESTSSADTVGTEANAGFRLDEWHHAAFSWGSGGMKLYLDGRLVDTDPYNGGLTGNTRDLILGASNDGWYHPVNNPDGIGTRFSGVLDQVALFDTQLADDRVFEHYFAEAVSLTVTESSNLPEYTVNGDHFRNERRIGVVTPSNLSTQSTLEIDLANLTFDTATGDTMILDAFELALLDADGNSVVPTIDSGRDAFFNVNENGTTWRASMVDYADIDQIVRIDVSHLAESTQYTLVARFINNDLDTTSAVDWPASVSFSSTAVTGPAAGTPEAAPPVNDDSVDLDLLQDVTDELTVAYTDTSYNESTDDLFVGLTVTHAGVSAIRGPLLVVVKNLRVRDGEPADAAPIRLINADGVTADLSPYVNLTSLAYTAADQLFVPSDTLDAELRFDNPDRVQFDYELVFYGLINTAPTFASDPYADVAGQAYAVENALDSANPGKRYVEVLANGNNAIQYALQGLDRESDTIDFSIVAGPDWLQIQTIDGVPTLTGVPSTSDAGIYAVTLRATDSPWGLYDPANDQTFNLHVISASANRPPAFTSDPVVDAYAGQPYTYPSTASDPDGDNLTFSGWAGGLPIGEAGTATSAADEGWTTVQLQSTYDSPVVIVGPPSNDGASIDPAAVRVRNVTATSFEFKLDEWAGDGLHGAQDVGYLVVEAGDHELPDGTRLVAGTASVGDTFTSIDFVTRQRTPFLRAPVVLTQVTTDTDTETVNARVKNIDARGFEVAVLPQENDLNGHGTETVAWIAIEGKIGSTGRLDYRAGVTGDTVDSTDHTVGLGSTFDAAPVLLGSLQTVDDTAQGQTTVRHTALTASGFTVHLDEEDTGGDGLINPTENFGFFAIESGIIEINTPEIGFDGQVTWTPPLELAGESIEVHLVVDDGNGGTDTQDYFIYVNPDPDPLPDLTVNFVEAPTPDEFDTELLTVSGTITADIANLGTADVTGAFDVLFFEDLDFDGAYTADVDNVLGQTTYTGGLTAGAEQTVSADIAGRVQYAGALVWAWVDSGDLLVESNEANNTERSHRDCVSLPMIGSFDPEIEWQRTYGTDTTNRFEYLPNYHTAYSVPVVADIDRDGTPDIIFTSGSGEDGTIGPVRALNGLTGEELFGSELFDLNDNPLSDTVYDTNYFANVDAGIAVANIDDDIELEIVAIAETFSHIRVYVFEHDGTVKSDWTVTPLARNGLYWQAPAVADIDHNGDVEIVVGGYVLSHDGTIAQQLTLPTTSFYEFSSIPIIANIDNNGSSEIIHGNLVFSFDDGEIADFWSLPAGGGTGFGFHYSGVANFDLDPYAELVYVRSGQLYLYDNDGTLLEGPLSIGSGGGAPTIGNFDGDPGLEIGIATNLNYRVIDDDWTVGWSYATNELSSGVTGSTLFDFDGDGRSEIVYRDETTLYAFRVPDTEGATELEAPLAIAPGPGSGGRVSITAHEAPIVADVDADGRAEIVVPQSRGTGRGIYVFGDANNSWMPTREIWNQNSYHITNVNDDGKIPINEEPSWLAHNTYRLNAQEGVEAGDAPDLIPSFLRTDDNGDGTTTYTVRIGNSGNFFAPAGVRVSFFDGDPLFNPDDPSQAPDAGATLLTTGLTQNQLDPGRWEDVSFTTSTAISSLHIVVDWYDDNGTWRQSVRECNEVNNEYAPPAGLNSGPTITSTPTTQIGEQEAYSYTLTATDPDSDPVTFEVKAKPDWLTFDGTATLSGTPGVADSGDHRVVVIADDGTGGKDVQVFDITVLNTVNTDPVIGSTPLETAVADAPYSYDVNATDAEESTLRYQLAVAPDGMSIHGTTGQINWRPDASQVGVHDVVVVVEDGVGGLGRQSYELTVKPANEAPVIGSVPTGPAIVGDQQPQVSGAQPWAYRVDATDPNGDGLTYRLVNGPSGAAFGAAGTADESLLTWTPSAVGWHFFEIAVDDGRGGVTPQAFWLEVGDNAAPSIGFGAADPVIAGAAWSVPLIITDDQAVDGTLDISIDTAAEARGMDVHWDGSQWLLRWQNPVPSQVGTFEATVTVTDTGTPQATVSATLTLPVNPAPSGNVPPEFKSTPTGPAVKGRAWSYSAYAEDLNGDTVTYSLDAASLANGITINASTGLVEWSTPVPGDHKITVTATEQGTAEAYAVSQEFELTVLGNAAPLFASAPSRVGLADTPETFTNAIGMIDWNGDGVTLTADAQTGWTVEFRLGGSSDAWSSSYSVATASVDPDAPSLADLRITAPADAVAGEHTVLLRLTDSEGDTSSHAVTVWVKASAAEDPAPTGTFSAPTVVALGDTFVGQIVASDPEGQTLNFTPVYPGGQTELALTIDQATGRVVWTPTEADLGQTYQYYLTVSDGTNTGEFRPEGGGFFELEVVSQRPQNTAPKITSSPSGQPVAGLAYSYQLTATDAEGDPVYWALDSAPAGAQVDLNTNTGLLTWVPTLSDVGKVRSFKILATDSLGAGAVQTIHLTARSSNTPPRFTSVPVVEGLDDTSAGNQPLTMVFRATDADGDYIRLTLDSTTSAKAGVVFEQLESGVARLTWSDPAAATHDIEVTADDGRGGIDKQAFTLTVTSGTIDTAPYFTSQPVTEAVGNQTYDLFTAVAVDPDGPVQYSLAIEGGGSALSIDANTGVVSWDGTGTPPTTLNVTVTATQNNVSTDQRFTVNIVAAGENGAPVFSGPAIHRVPDGANFSFFIQAVDPENAALDFSLPNGETGVSIVAATGEVTVDDSVIDPAAPVTFTVRAADPAGGFTDRTYTVRVDQAPSVDLRVSTSTPAPDGRAVFQVFAADDVGVADVSLKITEWDEVSGTPVTNGYSAELPVATNGLAVFDLSGFTADTVFRAVATVKDGLSQSATDELLITVTTPDSTAPEVTIQSPYDQTVITGATSLEGVINDNQTDLEYRVEAYPLDGGEAILLKDWTAITSGTATTFATIDPTLLENGGYDIVVFARDTSNVVSQGIRVSIDSNVKLGNFALSFTDFQGTVGGIPVSIVRSYDTLRADEHGDFGYGWELTIQKATADVQKAPAAGSTLGDLFFSEPAMTRGSRIGVTLGDGTRLNFTVDAESRDLGRGLSFGAGLIGGGGTVPVNMTFVSDTPGVSLQLYSADGGTQEPALVLPSDGNEFLDELLSGFDPLRRGYDLLLTTPDGFEYIIDGADLTLMSVRDQRGGRLDFSQSGSTEWVSAFDPSDTEVERLRIVRDANHGDRIDRIELVDVATGSPIAGQSIEYGYDPATGNLISVENRANETVTLAYGEDHEAGSGTLPNGEHILTTITDARGVDVMKVFFQDAANGVRLLSGIQDASGAKAGFGYTFDVTDPATGEVYTVEKVTDATSVPGSSEGVPTELLRDGRGNAVRSIQHEIDLATGSLLGYLITEFRYTDAANPDLATHQSQTFQLPSSTADRFFDEPAGGIIWASVTRFDSRGNPTATVAGVENADAFDADGNPIASLFDNRDDTTFYENYDAFGNPGKIITPDGVTENGFDPATGNLDETTQTFVDADGVRRTTKTTYDYDANGNLEKVTQYDDAGNPLPSSTFLYDTAGRLTSTTDANEVTRYFRYDNAGNQVLSYQHWEDPADADDIIDQTIVTRTAYDAERRVTASYQYVFSGEQNPDVADITGTQLLGTDPDWSTSTTYNAAGQVEKTVDRFGSVSFNFYDARGLLVETLSQTLDTSSGSPADKWLVSRTVYDVNGRAEYTLDPYVIDGSAFDPDNPGTYAHANSPSQTVDWPALGSQTLYDALGRVVETRRIEGLVVTMTQSNGLYTTQATTTGVSVRTKSQTLYDSAGRVLATINHNDPASGGDNARTDFYYDTQGRQIAVLGPAVDVVGFAGSVRGLTEYTYDNSGRQKLVRTNIVVTDLSNDHPDLATVARDESDVQVTEFFYDALGRAYKTLAHGDATTTADDVTSQTVYDALGRRVAEIDPLGRRTAYAYDDQGRLTGVTLPEVTDAADTGSTTGIANYTYGYDIYGNQTSIVDPKGNKTTFTYDHFGRQTSRTLPLGQAEELGTGFVESMHYDDTAIATVQAGATPAASTGGGQLAYSVDFEGNVTAYLYDNTATGGGRLVSKTYYDAAQVTGTIAVGESLAVLAARLGAAERVVTYKYDAFGRQVEVNDDAFATVTTYAYDAEGRQTQAVTPQGTINYAYDDLGRMSRTYTGSTDTRYTYDELGRLKTVTLLERKGAPVTADGNSIDWYGTNIDGETTTYEYDLVGNLDLVSHDWNDTVADYHYDALNRLELLEHIDTDADNNGVADDPEVRARFTYELLRDGSRSRVVEEFDTNGDGTLDKSQTFEWTYDALKRLVEERFDDGNDGPTGGDYVTRYAFDLASNRKQTQKDTGNDGSQAFTADETTIYTYDANDRLTVEDGPNDYTTYGYDNTVQTRKTVWTDDTLTTKVSETTFSYDAMGRMIQVAIDSDGDGNVDSTQTYEYDDRGLRVTEDDGTTKTTYLFDMQNHTGYAQVLEQGVDANGNGLEAAEVDRTFTLGHDVIAQAAAGVAAGAPLLFGYDGHGSTRAMIDALGQLVAAAQNDAAQNVSVLNYDAYGQALNFTLASAVTSLLYSGEATNAATGLQYLRARWYDAASGRFNRLDPFSGNLRDPQSLHKYLYTHGNPVMGIDPSGNFALAVTLVTLSVSAYISAALIQGTLPAVRLAAKQLATIADWTAVTVSFVDALGKEIGDPLDFFLWQGLNPKDNPQALIGYVGATLWQDGVVRSWYIRNVGMLGITQSGARTNLKVSARRASSPIGAAISEWLAPIKKENVRVGGTANKTRSSINRIYANARWAGPVMMVAGAGISLYNIKTADDPGRAFAQEAGAWAGALSLGWAGAKGGALLGTAIGGPLGGAIGAVIGGVGGAILGANLGERAGDNYYDFFYEQ